MVVKDLSLPLSDKERKHLIITGRNGSGKTSLLLELNKYLTNIYNGKIENRRAQLSALDSKKQLLNTFSTSSDDINYGKNSRQIADVKSQINNINNYLSSFGNACITFANEHLLWEKARDGTFIIAFFEAKRHAQIDIPSGISKIRLQHRYDFKEKANKHFIQYLVNLKANRSFARDDDLVDEVTSIDKWFKSFQERLREIFESPTLELKFDRKNYNFQIIEEDKEPYEFDKLSDGYSAIISIVTELLLRMEAHQARNYDMEGLVLIDEIETHLHVELQKKILPFLTNFFPRIQFIVTTHSPFVLSSLANSVVCDLESNIVTSDLSGYSYDALLESYFYSDKYSSLIKAKIVEYEKLSLADQLDAEEKQRLKELEKYFLHIPKYLSNELLVKLQEITLKSLTAKRS